MTASTDLDGLGRALGLPASVASARWAAERMGASSAFDMLGPTDTQLVAHLRFHSPEDAAAALAPLQRPPEIQVPHHLAAQVLPERLLAGLPRVADEVLLSGPFFDGACLGRGAYRVALVAALDAGLLVYARSW